MFSSLWIPLTVYPMFSDLIPLNLVFILCLVFILPTQIGVYPLYTVYSTHSNLCLSCV